LADPQTRPVLITSSETIHRRVAENRRRVCQVAARLFNASSYEAVSIEAIAAEAGIARSTFYRFFQDKEDLVRQIAVPILEDAGRFLSRLDPDKPELIVNGIADCYLEIWGTRRDELILSVNIEPLFALVQDAHDVFAKTVLSLMERVNSARLLRHDDPQLAAVMVARTAVRILHVCEQHEQFENVFRSTLRGMLLKW